MSNSQPFFKPATRISPPYIFSQSSCTGIFISCIGPPTMAILPKWSSPKLLNCQVLGPRGNTRTKPASIEQLRNLPLIQVCSRVVSISNSTLKGQTRGMLGKHCCLRCGEPLSVDLDHRVSGARGTTELVARADRQLLSVCNIMFLCQHLGVAPEEGAYMYSRDKTSDPTYKPPTLSTSAKVAKRGEYMWDTTVHVAQCNYNYEVLYLLWYEQ